MLVEFWVESSALFEADSDLLVLSLALLEADADSDGVADGFLLMLSLCERLAEPDSLLSTDVDSELLNEALLD